MEGFLNIRVRPWLRRLVTRSMAVIPAAIVVYYWGAKGTYSLLLLSQVVLSAQLSFAVIPLIHFTNDPGRMGSFANKRWLRCRVVGVRGGDRRPERLATDPDAGRNSRSTRERPLPCFGSSPSPLPSD